MGVRGRGRKILSLLFLITRIMGRDLSTTSGVSRGAKIQRSIMISMRTLSRSITSHYMNADAYIPIIQCRHVYHPKYVQARNE
ncbi:hypothetical protein EDB19DRAFT_1752124 [Suillus lakei]|nr:hypothetical protein EDB19DRAFT_1752124 [Suillus lakei]